MSDITGISETKKMLKGLCGKAMRLSKDAMLSVAQEAASQALSIYSVADYDGDRNVTVTASPTRYGAKIVARGPSVLFMEYGAGVTYSSEQHPWNDEHGMGPGTYPTTHPGRKNSYGVRVPNWMNDKGWYFGSYGFHTFGNPPAMAMYQAYKTVEEKAPKAVSDAMRAL